MKKIIAISILLLTIIVLFSGCVSLKGTYSSELSEQYTKATYYEVSSGQLIPKAGVGWKVYITSGNAVNIYNICACPNATEKFVKNAIIDKNGVIDTGWIESSDIQNAYIQKYFGGSVPPSGLAYYFYYGPISRGYNVIYYTRDFLHNVKYAEVKGLGLYSNGEIIMYNFE